jgi:hypothetical protein
MAAMPLQRLPMPRLLLAFGLFMVSVLPVAAQVKAFEAGGVTAADLQMTSFPDDSEAVALTLYDYGKTRFIAKDDGLRVLFRCHTQIKILREEGLERGTFHIELPSHGGDIAQLVGVQATTYNWEGGKIVKTELKESDVFDHKVNEAYREARFTMPAMKVGSVVEVIYSVASSNFLGLQQWYFQSEDPVRRSDYSVVIPAYFNYKVAYHGYLPFAEQTMKETKETYHFLNGGDVQVTAGQWYWRMENLPAFKREPFMNAPQNYEAHLEFELAAYEYPGQAKVTLTNDWPTFAKNVLALDKLWAKVDNAKPFAKIVNEITDGATTPLEKAKRIYSHLQTKLKCLEVGGLFPDHSPIDTYSKGEGGVSDIHVTLLAMLRAAGLSAHPALLSTTMHTRISEDLPLLTDFNYLVVALDGEEGGVFLDLSDPCRPFGILPYYCLAGKIVVLDPENTRLLPSLHDEIDLETIALEFTIDQDGHLTGKARRELGGLAAHQYRLAHSPKIAGILTPSPRPSRFPTYAGWEITDTTVTGLPTLETNIVQTFNLRSVAPLSATGALLFLAPLHGIALTNNLFPNPTRIYPVDIGFPIKRHVQCTISLPAGYKVDELPVGALVSLPEDGGRFRFLANEKDGKVHLTSTINLGKPSYPASYYAALRELLDGAIGKHHENIVLQRQP